MNSKRPRIRIFQFLSLQPAELLVRFLARFKAYGVTVILDFEDNLWDPEDADLTAERKAQARRRLVQVSGSFPEIFHAMPIGVRVNRLSSAEFPNDLETLAAVSQQVPLHTVILPKVESAGDLHGYDRHFSIHHVRCQEYIPIIETCAGMKEIENILAAAKTLAIRFINYGHYDYSLDAGQWPFIGQDDPRFWEWVTPFLCQVEACGLHYFHTPFGHTTDDDRFREVLSRLSSLCRREFAVSALGLRQIALARQPDLWRSTPPPEAAAKTDAPDLDRKMEMAELIKTTYLANRRRNFGFTLDPRSGTFITPHEYVAALNFLKIHGR